jgi:glycosyltransferase involved in cell wall biosynthesis
LSIPFFSVIIPTFNRDKFIVSTILSVINQEFQDFEIIIIDDGSNDNTCNFVKSIDDVRINYFFQENQERSWARNNGIQKSRGIYICFLDSDDGYYSNHLDVLYHNIIIHETPKALFYTGIECKNQNQVKRHPLNFKKLHPVDFIWSNFLLMNSVCVRRDVFHDFLFPVKFNLWEDTHLWLRIALNHPVIEIQKYSCYTIEHEEASTKYNRKSKLFDIYLKYREAVNDVFIICPTLYTVISRKSKKEYICNKAQYFLYESINLKSYSNSFKLLFFKIYLDRNLISFLINLKLILKKVISF